MRSTSTSPRPARAASLVIAVVLCASLTACGGNRNSEAAVARAAGIDNGSARTVQEPAVTAPAAAGTTTIIADGNAAAPTSPATGAAPAIAPGVTGPGAVGHPAVGSGKGSPAAGTTKPGTETTTGTRPAGPANLSPINLGFVGTFSGPVGSLVLGTTTGARVWAKYTNDNGGVNGHPVNVIVADDAGDPARYQSLLKQLVEQDKVIAFLQNTLGLAPAGNNEYLNSKKIMTLSTEGGSNQPYENPYVVTAFPTGTTYAQGIISGVAQYAVPAGKIKLGSIACSDFSICDLFDTVWKNPQFLKTIGLTPTFAARPSLTQPDYTATCISAKQAGVNLLVFGMDSASIARFASDCARQNYHPMLGTGDIVVNATLPEQKDVDGIVIGTKIAPWTATDVPGVKQFVDAMRRYDPGVEPYGTAQLGFAAGQFFAVVGRNLPANPTPADIFKAVYEVQGSTLGGLTYPLNFTKAKTAPKRLCFGAVVVRGGKFTSPPGPALRCASS